MKWKNDTLVLNYCATEDKIYKKELAIDGINVIHNICEQ
jgi:hypothetical protein